MLFKVSTLSVPLGKWTAARVLSRERRLSHHHSGTETRRWGEEPRPRGAAAHTIPDMHAYRLLGKSLRNRIAASSPLPAEPCAGTLGKHQLHSQKYRFTCAATALGSVVPRCFTSPWSQSAWDADVPFSRPRAGVPRCPESAPSVEMNLILAAGIRTRI